MDNKRLCNANKQTTKGFHEDLFVRLLLADKFRSSSKQFTTEKDPITVYAQKEGKGLI